MAKILLYMTCAVLTIIIGCKKPTYDNTSEKQGENTLIDFYSKYFDIWKNNQDIWKDTGSHTKISVNTRKEKLDSLMKIYCTSKVRNEALETYENSGADLMTQNFLGDINENLKVEKVTEEENSYTVSFTSTILEIPSKPLKQNVILHVTLVKDNKSYKIFSVK